MTVTELRNGLERYLALRRALGFEMLVEEKLLRDFARFAEQQGLAHGMRARVALDWACSNAPRCGAVGQARRLSLARGFLNHLSASISNIEVPGPGLLAAPIRPKPHIYSDEEIQALRDAARDLRPKGSLRPYTVATLIGLLVSTGLRISEAIRLRLCDVDLDSEPACLRVVQTKFRKSRFVPLHHTTAAALRAYENQRRRSGCDGVCEHFFVSTQGTPLNYQAVARTFSRLCQRLGIGSLGDRRAATLHSLRHTFAVRRLIEWYRAGVDVHARIPELSTYLGHVRPEDTYWYLTATPQLLIEASGRFEAAAAGGQT